MPTGTIPRLDNARNMLDAQLAIAIDELGTIADQSSPEWMDLQRAIARASAPLNSGFVFGEAPAAPPPEAK